MGWRWDLATDCDYFFLLRAQPAEGEELEEVTYGTPIPGRSGMVRCYTVAVCLSGRIHAEWGDGSTSVIEGFQYGPGRGEQDRTIIPEGRVYYRAETDDVDFICIKPKRREGRLCLEQDYHTQPTNLPAKPDSWVCCLRGEITVNGQTYGQLDAFPHPGGQLAVDCTPDAAYVQVWRRV